jgi:arsenate reductase
VRNTKTVLFACVRNDCRSQIAAALFNSMADPAKARATSAGTRPATAIHPEVVQVLAEERLDAHLEPPKPLTPDLLGTVSHLITMGWDAPSPAVPGLTCEEWPLADPRGASTTEVRRIREVIRAWVVDLIVRNGWERA